MAMNFEISAAQTNRLFTHCLEQLEAHPRWSASPQLSHVQNMLMAYLRMDKIAEEEGFAALIAQGWGETVLNGALAETLAQWGIDVLPHILRQAACITANCARRLRRRRTLRPMNCARPFRSSHRWMKNILLNAKKFSRRCTLMCARITMILPRCWIFRRVKFPHFAIPNRSC